MEENVNVNADTENAADQELGTEQENTQEESERLFTQSELDTIVAKRLARAQRGMPSENELKEFKTWKESQQSQQEKIDELKKSKKETEAALNETLRQYETLRRERYLIDKGVAVEDVDYYAFKIGKLVDEDTDFEEAAKKYLEKHKGASGAGVRINLTGSLNGGGKKATSTNETMNNILRGNRNG